MEVHRKHSSMSQNDKNFVEHERDLYDSGNFSEPRTSPNIESDSQSEKSNCFSALKPKPNLQSCVPTSSSDEQIILSSPKPLNSSVSPDLHNIVENFNKLYEQKIHEANNLETKNTILSDWVEDLKEQNSVLIQTVQEMEREAESKIQFLQKKIRGSSTLLVGHMNVIEEYEKQVQGFKAYKEETDEQFKEVNSEVTDLMQKLIDSETKLDLIKKEQENLLTLLTRIRDSGMWDLNGLTLCTSSYKRLFDLYPNLPGNEVKTVFQPERSRQLKDCNPSLELERRLSNTSTKVCSKGSFPVQEIGAMLDAVVKSSNTVLDVRPNETVQIKDVDSSAECLPTSSDVAKELRERLRNFEEEALEKDTLVKQLMDELNQLKISKVNIEKEVESRSVEIKMQKLTITHLQNALVDIKRGGYGRVQPISSSSNGIQHL